ncbi:copper resistance CopC family protein [Pedococcus sp. KACC 23699]|uniref:Copper resistance CopC family protein n=1 Tax=Pedococcus sp. KACC 23699 TaxID=3149228 RepID=A0AAU7JUW4_9MICO
MESEGKRRTIRITVWVAVLGLLLGVLSSIIGAVSADAHAALKSVTPGDGSTVSTAPTTVTLSFNEPIGTTFATVTVTGPSGNVGNGRPKVEGTTVTEELDADLPNGVYKVAFRVVSEDGHPVSDTSSFTIKAAQSSPTSEPTMTPGNSATPPSASSTASTESPTAATASNDNGGQSMRLGLAFGVGALAVAAGTALVAAARRRGRS